MIKILYSEEQIAEMTKKMAAEIDEVIKDEERIPMFIGVMKGSLNFMMDLIKNIKHPIFTDYIQTASYEGTKSGTVRLMKDISYDIENRTVVIVEDIVDTGKTMKFLIEHIKAHHPKRVLVATMVDKKKARLVPIEADFVGFDLPENKFIIGYGLDYNQLDRNVPYIYIPEPEDVQKLDNILAKDKKIVG